eukprot:1345658-Amphidinium_carterae.1
MRLLSMLHPIFFRTLWGAPKVAACRPGWQSRGSRLPTSSDTSDTPSWRGGLEEHAGSGYQSLRSLAHDALLPMCRVRFPHALVQVSKLGAGTIYGSTSMPGVRPPLQEKFLLFEGILVLHVVQEPSPVLVWVSVSKESPPQ